MLTSHPLTPPVVPFGEDHSATQAHQEAPKRGRGRPTVEHDNRRVKAFLIDYRDVPDLLEVHPALSDVFAGVGAARSDGDTAERPLPASRLFTLLAACDTITTKSVTEALAWASFSMASVKRYTLTARTLSLFIARELDRRQRLATVLD